MSEQADARRMQLLEMLAASEEPQDIDALAKALRCDARTIRRDVDQLQQLLQRTQGVEVKRGRVSAARSGTSTGYFTGQLERNTAAKEAIAQAVVRELPDGMAIALTAGSTPYAVAREMRRVAVEGLPPHNLIVFTNSVPAFLELVAASITTGMLGEIYSTEDCALHSPDFHSAFQPGIAIVGASGVTFGANGLDLFSHRAEEAAFMKQLLASVPEVVVAVDSSKLGKRHPWSFGGGVLHHKRVRLVTETLPESQRGELDALAERLSRHGTQFSYIAADRVTD